MTVMAHYPGTCAECGGRFDKGDQIVSTIDHDRRRLVWQHAGCPDDPADATTLRPGEQVCTTCWLSHPEGTCDR